MNRRIKSGDEWKDKPVFVDCTCWARTAEFIGQHGRKGSAALVSGELDLDTWQDKQTGANRQKLKIQAQTVQLLGKRTVESQEPHNSEYGAESQVAPDPKFASDPPAEEIPF